MGLRKYKVLCPIFTSEEDCPYCFDGECAIEKPLDECDEFYWHYCDGNNELIKVQEKRTAYVIMG